MADAAQLDARLAAAIKARGELEAQLILPEVLADHTALARIGRELARTAPLAVAAADLAAARKRIAEAHSKSKAPGGMTSGDCDECGWSWPCPTYRWASGEGDPTFSTWQLDDESGER